MARFGFAQQMPSSWMSGKKGKKPTPSPIHVPAGAWSLRNRRRGGGTGKNKKEAAILCSLSLDSKERCCPGHKGPCCPHGSAANPRHERKEKNKKKKKGFGRLHDLQPFWHAQAALPSSRCNRSIPRRRKRERGEIKEKKVLQCPHNFTTAAKREGTAGSHSYTIHLVSAALSPKVGKKKVKLLYQ